LAFKSGENFLQWGFILVLLGRSELSATHCITQAVLLLITQTHATAPLGCIQSGDPGVWQGLFQARITLEPEEWGPAATRRSRCSDWHGEEGEASRICKPPSHNSGFKSSPMWARGGLAYIGQERPLTPSVLGPSSPSPRPAAGAIDVNPWMVRRLHPKGQRPPDNAYLQGAALRRTPISAAVRRYHDGLYCLLPSSAQILHESFSLSLFVFANKGQHDSSATPLTGETASARSPGSRWATHPGATAAGNQIPGSSPDSLHVLVA
jgi:hypothetical protein